MRFSTPSGTPLAYEIEEWDQEAGVASIWVRIPSIGKNGIAALTFCNVPVLPTKPR
ncbi:MAG: DUF2341 domain-containing protein [Planctomycetota bacterium]|nr:DUF2341 domain-containing protein [Planctomycetota bacterium]MDP7134538.1 DUF2341 domain-containing protein [Planctomycetota bacterium]